MSEDMTLDELAQMVAAGFDQVNHKLDKLSERVKNLEERLGYIETRLGRVENRLEELVEELAVEQAFTSKVYEDHEPRIAALEAELS